MFGRAPDTMPPMSIRSALAVVASGVLAGCAPGARTATSGNTTVNARMDGSFDVVIDGRTLLAGAPRPVTIRQFDPQAPMLWGQFSYDPGTITTAAPSQLSRLYTDGTDVVLELDGAGANATIRFGAGHDGEVPVRIHAAAPSLNARGLELRFACTPEARFLGFGEQYEKIDHRGEAFPLWVTEQGIGRDPDHPGPYAGDPWTSYFPVPFFLDPRGFGLALDTDARVAVDLCKSDPAVYALTVDDGGDALLHLYTGPAVADVLSAFTLRQGRSSDPPAWATAGAWIGVQGGPDKVRGAADRARAAGIPVAAVWVQDWIGRLDLGGGLWDLQYHWTADTTLYPDLPGLIRGLHGEGVRFLGYFNPFVLPTKNQWADAVAKGYIIHQPDGTPYTTLVSVFSASMIDLTNPDAVAWFQGFAKTALSDGMDGWMDDFGEWLPYDAKLAHGDAPHEHNRYPSEWHKATTDLFDGGQVNLTRSGWLGEGKTAQVVWAGDQQADWDPWDGLPTVVPAMISLGLAGVGWVTHDVAGFSGGPSTKELYLRWLELGAFTPILRTHEGLAADKNWRWDSDAETLAAFGRWARVHAVLADTFVKLAAEHAATGMPMVRALALGWPDDPAAVPIADEYTVGSDLLVAPVMTMGATSRMVYFPKGHWVDVWDPMKSVDGPVARMIDAPIGRPPVFSQSGRGDLQSIR